MDFSTIIQGIGALIVMPLIVEGFKAYFFGKSVVLNHEISSNIYSIQGIQHNFTTLIIRNLGKLTAKDVRIVLDKKSLDHAFVDIITSESFTKDLSTDKIIYHIPRLLPDDKIEIIFRKENEVFKTDSLLIQSDEVVSVLGGPVETEVNLKSIITTMTTTLFTLIAVSFIFNRDYSIIRKSDLQDLLNKPDKFVSITPNSEIEIPDSKKLELIHFIEKPTYHNNEALKYKITVKNLTKQLMSGINIESKIAGTDYTEYDDIPFLKPNETATINKKVDVKIIKALPIGTHAIETYSSAKQLGDLVTINTIGKFEITN